MATMAAAVSGGGSSSGGGKKAAAFKDKDKPDQVRSSNMVAAKAVADLIRTSLGPKGMDKMIQVENGDVSITNDGATILKQISVNHPCARMLVELSQAQDVAAGDGTTSVVVLAGSLLAASEKLLAKGIHPTAISEAFQRAATAAEEILASMATPVDLADTELLTKIAATSLNSKMVSQSSHLLAPMAVKAIRGVTEAEATDVDLKRIKVIKKLGGTVEDSELVEGAVFDQKASGAPGAPTRMEKAKIGLIQFQLSPPKTDMENTVVIQDYAAMDRALREERAYLLELCKGIKKAGCNVLLIQKSILRDAVNEMSLHFLAKMKIMVVKDVERDDIEFICRSIGCRPVASLDHFTPEALGTAELVEEVPTADGKLIKVTGVANPGKALSLIIRGSNKLMLDEAERSIHDALCVLRCLVKKRGMICGGGAPEMEMGVRIREMGLGQSGVDGYCFRAFADAVEIVPYTLAENAGLNPIQTVTELRNRHAKGEKTAGINVRKGFVTNILEESVVQPLLVSASAIRLATETVRSILKIDDVLRAMRD